MSNAEANAPASPAAEVKHADQEEIGRGSPESAASDSTPVTKNAAPPKKKKGNLHSMWESQTTSWSNRSGPQAPPTTVRTTTPAWSAKPKPKKESAAATAASSAAAAPVKPPPQAAVKTDDDELALLKKELEAMAKAKVEPKKEEAPKPPPPPPVEKESAPLTPPRNIKNEAKKFEVKAEGGDELTLLKKELEALQGKPEEPEPKKDAAKLSPKPTEEPKKDAAKLSPKRKEVEELEKKKTVKKAAMKFDPTVKAEADDELAKLKKELAALAGNKEEDVPKKEEKTSPTAAAAAAAGPKKKKKKNVHSFWEQKTKDSAPIAVNKSTPFNQTASYTKSPPEKKGKKLEEAGDDAAKSDRADEKIFAATVTTAAAATALVSATSTEGAAAKPQAPTTATSGAVKAEETSTSNDATPPVNEDVSLASKSFDNDSITSGDTAQLMSEFRGLVEKLVRKSMPSEIDHIDELVEEYEGREEELLEILSAMEGEGEGEKGDASNEERSTEGDSKENDATGAVAAVTGAAVVATAAAVASSGDKSAGLEDITSFGSDLHVYEDDQTAPSYEIEGQKESGDIDAKNEEAVVTNKGDDTNSVEAAGVVNDADVDTLSKGENDSIVSKKTAHIGNVVLASPDPERHEDADIETGETAVAALKSVKEPCWKRNKLTLLTLAIIVILAGAAIPIGIIFSTPRGSENQKGFDKPIGDGRPTPENGGQIVPGVTPDGNGDDNGEPSAPTIEEDLSTFCTSERDFIKSALQPDVTKLNANNPLVAVDGTNAIVATGSGYVSFYSLEGTTWQRKENFGILASNGDVKSVSISKNTAVIGLPKASPAVGPDGPVETGMIVTYERNPESKAWRQAKSLVPNEYSGSAMRYQGSNFGQSVSIYDDLLVVGAPSEEGKRGSVTVFKKDGTGSGWNQLIKLGPGAGTCKDTTEIYLGYSVDLHRDTIAASADCAENIMLYKYDRTGSGRVTSSQFLQRVDKTFGAVTSVGMNGEDLVYSTAVQGGLFIFRRDENTSDFGLSQELTFGYNSDLFEYPVVVSDNLFVLAADNKFYVYTQAEQGAKWMREPLVLQTDGDFKGYVPPGLGVSNGNVLVGSNTDIDAYLSTCVPEIVVVAEPEPNCVVVSITLDSYPTDTSWTIEDSNGNLIASNSPYEESMAGTTQVQEVCDLSDGEYSFTIFDVYADGMCCDWGEGSYNVTTKSGLTIATGGKFGASERTLFSMPFTAEGSSSSTETDQTLEPTNKPSPAPTDPPIPAPTLPPTPVPTMQPTPVPTEQTPVEPTCTTVEISVTLDDYPSDTSWNLVDSSGTVVASSPAYDASMAGSTQVESICLPPGAYSFVISDVYEDGICCDWGQGSYSLTTSDGQLLASGGEWSGPSETKTFTIT